MSKNILIEGAVLENSQIYCLCDSRSEETYETICHQFQFQQQSLCSTGTFIFIKACFQNKNIPSGCLKKN